LRLVARSPAARLHIPARQGRRGGRRASAPLPSACATLRRPRTS